MDKDLVSCADLTRDELNGIISLGRDVKATPEQFATEFQGRTLVLLFEKPSLRTRVTFEVAMTQCGGGSLFLGQNEVAFGKRESIADGARNLSLWVDFIAVRTFSEDFVRGIARHSTVPVINALTDREHPCQALAFYMTLSEVMPGAVRPRIVFVGDGNNVAHSLMLAAPLYGADFVLSCPENDKYHPDPGIFKIASDNAKQEGTSVSIVHDPFKAVRDADVIYTDIWASMGQENESDIRSRVFTSYQVNSEMLDATGKKTYVTHCLPAHRGEEITDDVLDGEFSIAFKEAENRLHVQKSILLTLKDHCHS